MTFEAKLSQGKVAGASLIHPHPAHDAYSFAPVFVYVETVNLNVGRDGARQSGERAMEMEHGRHQIDQRRFVADYSISEKLCFSDVTAPAMGLYSPPVVHS